MIQQKKLIILGAGESGTGAAILGKRKGWDVFVSDIGTIKKEYIEQLKYHGITDIEQGYHTEETIFKADLIIKSPGIPDSVPLIKALRAKNIKVIDEIEFASYYNNKPIVAITGSNGKTTTTKLTHHILKTGGMNIGLGGNIGFSFAKMVAEEIYDAYTLELSSFQLDNIEFFHPQITILLNITPDHLDRYQYELKNYIASKFRIIRNQNFTNQFIYNANDKYTTDYYAQYEKAPLQQSLPTSYPIDLSQQEDDNYIWIDDFKIRKEELTLQGKHNYFNILTAVKTALIIGIEHEKIREALRTFKNEPHRLEQIATINGVEYINDSKATNVDAVYYALEAMKKPVIWIVGGQDKGNDYSPLMSLVEKKVKAIICLGKDNLKIIEAFQDIVENIEDTHDTSDAVYAAQKYAQKGDVVLLSPACASFDLFRNYMHRGDEFRKIVNNG